MITQEELDLRQKELNGNIDLYNVGDKFCDNDIPTYEVQLDTGGSETRKGWATECTIISKTSNSLLVLQPAKTPNGIDAWQYYFIKDFEWKFVKNNKK